MSNNQVPKVSVVVVTFNRVALLRDRALASIRKQTYSDWECLVIDNGCTDDTESVVRAISLEEPRIRYLKNENIGVALARTFGARSARGAYIAFLDDDDEFLPAYLEHTIDAIETQSDEVACVAPISIARDFDGGQTYGYYELEPFWKYSIGSCCFFKRKVFFEDGLSFDPHLDGFEDVDFHIQFHLSGHKLYRLWEPLVICAMGRKRPKGGSLTATNHARLRKGFDAFFAKNEGIYEIAGVSAIAWICSFGGLLYLNDGKMAAGRKLLWRSFRSQPAVLPLLYISMSFFGQRFFRRFFFIKADVMRFLRVHLMNGANRAPKHDVRPGNL